jgi:phosphopantetheinyl transferase
MRAVFRLIEVVGPEARLKALLSFCSEQLKVSMRRLALSHDDLGAPVLLLDGVAFSWSVSTSSRENVALFGLSRERIGVDVELGSDIEPAWNVLHAEEKKGLKALPEAARPEEFLRLWTAKEAYLKALGLGLRREPSEICIRTLDDAFNILDRGKAVVTREAWSWREKVGPRLALCASVVLPELS